MSDRFFVEIPIEGSTLTLDGAEATHLVKVMRARVGESLVAFDGRGCEFHCRIDEIQRQKVTCQILEAVEVDREASRRVALYVGLPKGDRQRILIEKLTELGVSEVTPLITRRGVVQPDGGTVERLQRFVIEASKQCGRNRLMAIHPPQSVDEILEASRDTALRLVAHPRREDAVPLAQLNRDVESPVHACIGPEGGFDDGEVARLQTHGWRTLDLGPRILRVETAATVIAAVATLGG